MRFDFLIELNYFVREYQNMLRVEWICLYSQKDDKCKIQGEPNCSKSANEKIN